MIRPPAKGTCAKVGIGLAVSIITALVCWRFQSDMQIAPKKVAQGIIMIDTHSGRIAKWLAIAMIGTGLVCYGATTLGASRWSRATRALVARLDAATHAPNIARYDAAEVAGLPPPVRRYFTLALTDGQPIIRSADISMAGTFNMSLDAPQWKPFTSEQHVVTDRPGFVWDARIRFAPGLPVRVHDAYVTGEGILTPSILGLIPLGAVQGGGEIARGELLRWFAEAVWYPTALLPSQGVVWQAVDDTSAIATLADGPFRLDMLFRFGADGLVSGIRVEARGGMVGGETVMMPWVGTFRDYHRQDGMLIPFHGEVAWITSQGERPYFRGTVAQVTFGFGP